MKKFNQKQKPIDIKKKHLIHNDSNNNNSPKKVKHIPSTSSNIHNCDVCGDCYGEMISCDTCSSTFHLLCINPSLSKEDISKGSYFCENCRRIKKPQEDFKQQSQKLILPFSFDPKKNLYTNGLKKTLGQIKLPTGI
jgi:hypothetical protein